MKHPPNYWRSGKKYLAKKDTVMVKLIKSHKGHLITRNDVFFSLCKSIIGQQISVTAASSIFLRFKKIIDRTDKYLHIFLKKKENLILNFPTSYKNVKFFVF